jgi:hypothetical protein
MRKSPRFFRLTASVALTSLLGNAVLPPIAVAQPAPPPLPAAGNSRPDLNRNQGDPPERVGRIASMTGAVSFHNPGDTQWSAATPNYPVSSGNAFWTEAPSSARLEVSDSRIVMAGSTEFDVSTLDVNGLQGVVAEGEVYLHLRDLVPSEAWSIQTPRGLVHLGGPGRYGIVAGTTDQPTAVTVLEGSAQIEGPGVSLQVAAGQTAMITGTDSFQGSVGLAVRDAFLTASLSAERPPPASSTPAPQRVVSMCGGSDLADTGSWSQAPTYGQVWYPPVAATWVPYREGHWAYVEPWGWTWIDDASWGFAPFHYGRWVQIDGRWGWTPGQAAVQEQPVYAPALVAFIGVGAGVAIGAALASGSIGWVPLGPHEPYHPWYHASNNYIRHVNISHVTNITNTTNNITTNTFINRGAATEIPAAAMVASRPVYAVARPIAAQQFAAARPIVGQLPIRPTTATTGVTPVVARQLNLSAAPGAFHAAPGPAVRPAAAGTTGFARPTLAPAPTERTQAPAAGTAQPGAAQPGRPEQATPGARPIPGERPAGSQTPEAVRPPERSPTAPRPELPNAARPEAARPGGAPTPEVARPASAVPQVAPPGASNAARPGAAPAVTRPEPEHRVPEPIPAVRPAELQPAAPRPAVAPPPATRPAAVAPAAPRPAAVAPAAARPAVVPPSAPRPAEIARPAPRPTPPPPPPRPAAPAPHPAVQTAAPPHPEPPQRKKEPGER